MKYFLVAMIMMNSAFAILPKEKASQVKTTVKTVEIKTGDKAKDALKEKEDCDAKVKKKVEINPEAMSLSGGTAGCTLE